MEFYPLNRGFLRQSVIDEFESGIWTERYYGDGDVTLVVPATKDMLQKLIPGTLLACNNSKEVMLLDTYDVKDGALKVTGNGILPFLNNRFIRATAAHEDQYWTIVDTPGNILWDIVYYMCINGTYPLGIPNPASLVIPGLGAGSIDSSGPVTTVAVPYGPVFDALKNIATTYQAGMKITLESATDSGYSIQFSVYYGIDRTSTQSVNPPVRFSPEFDSLTNIEELQSMTNYDNVVFSFAPSNPDGLATTPGEAAVPGSYTGFDLRALMTFEEDITTDQVGGNPATLLSILNSRASDALDNNKYVKTVDGEITPLSQFQYGVHYNMGDIVEMQGESGAIQRARITEYIRSQDNTGERAYPTVAIID